MQTIKGDLLLSDVDIILHQVNLQGVMGGGIAYQIAKTYPNVEKRYKEFNNAVLGEVCFVETDKYVVGNVYSQNADFTTNYQALREALEKVDEYMRKNKLKSVGIPYGYGCGIASGNWYLVSKIFEQILGKYDLKVYNIH